MPRTVLETFSYISVPLLWPCSGNQNFCLKKFHFWHFWEVRGVIIMKTSYLHNLLYVHTEKVAGPPPHIHISQILRHIFVGMQGKTK